MSEKEKRPVGRPTDYKPEYCSIVINLLKEGASIEEIALELDCNPDSIYEWMNVHEEFSDAIKKGRAYSKGWWLREGRTNLQNKEFSPTLWYMNMKNRFGWSDKNESTHNVTVKHEDQLSELE